MHGNALRTGGGLTKKDLKYNKQGKIVSKTMSMRAKREKRLEKAGWTVRKGQFGAFKMSGRVMGEPIKRIFTENIKKKKIFLSKPVIPIPEELYNFYKNNINHGSETSSGTFKYKISHDDTISILNHVSQEYDFVFSYYEDKPARYYTMYLGVGPNEFKDLINKNKKIKKLLDENPKLKKRYENVANSNNVKKSILGMELTKDNLKDQPLWFLAAHILNNTVPNIDPNRSPSLQNETYATIAAKAAAAKEKRTKKWTNVVKGRKEEAKPKAAAKSAATKGKNSKSPTRATVAKGKKNKELNSFDPFAPTILKYKIQLKWGGKIQKEFPLKLEKQKVDDEDRQYIMNTINRYYLGNTYNTNANRNEKYKSLKTIRDTFMIQDIVNIYKSKIELKLRKR